VVHGAPCRFSDPARMSLAHGGKDGHPFPVPLKVYDGTIRVLKDALSEARLGRDEKLEAIRRLDAQARRLETALGTIDFDAFVASERAQSESYGGRTVQDDVTCRTIQPRDPAPSSGIDASMHRSVGRMAERG
jgi:uncharacterized protein